jgi:hypothetical protein
MAKSWGAQPKQCGRDRLHGGDGNNLWDRDGGRKPELRNGRRRLRPKADHSGVRAEAKMARRAFHEAIGQLDQILRTSGDPEAMRVPVRPYSNAAGLLLGR